MKVSELITKLLELQEEVGSDAPVWMQGGMWAGECGIVIKDIDGSVYLKRPIGPPPTFVTTDKANIPDAATLRELGFGSNGDEA